MSSRLTLDARMLADRYAHLGGMSLVVPKLRALADRVDGLERELSDARLELCGLRELRAKYEPEPEHPDRDLLLAALQEIRPR